MIKANFLFFKKLNQMFFSLIFLGIIFIFSAFTLIKIPLLPQPLFIHFYAIICFISLLYLPASSWLYLALASLWLDWISGTTFGCHILFVALQYLAIFLMRTFVKDYGFVFQWFVFSLSFVLIYGILGSSNYLQYILTIILYPFLFKWLIKFFSLFKQVNYG